MKFKAYPKWVSVVFSVSTIGWIVMVIIDFVTKKDSGFAFYAHIALAAIYLICTIVYAIQYALSKRTKAKQTAAQEAAKFEAEKQAAVEQAIAQKKADDQQAAVRKALEAQEAAARNAAGQSAAAAGEEKTDA